MQQIFVDDKIYDAISYLYIMQGKAQPSSALPWSGAEFQEYLEVIEYDALSPEGKAIYDRLDSLLGIDANIGLDSAMPIKLGVDLQTNVLLHSNEKRFGKELFIRNPIVSEQPFLTAYAEFWGSTFAFAHVEVSLGFSTPVASMEDKGKVNLASDERYDSMFASNIPFLSAGSLSMAFPQQGYVSLGRPGVNLIIGRAKAKWGVGKTGNLFIGGNLPYDDIIRFNIYSEVFNYTFLLDLFCHPQNLAKAHTDEMQGIQFLMAHRLEFWLFKKKLSIAIEESVMYQSTDGSIQWQVINPFLIFHNYYMKANANSLAGLEIGYTIIPGLNLYGQFVLDDLAIAGEEKQPESGASPNAAGYLAGIKYYYPLGPGYIYSIVEGAYTDPFLYLRNKEPDSVNYGNTDFIATIRQYSASATNQTNYRRRYVGYQYGGDAIVADLSIGYQIPFKYGFETEIFYMAHGITRMDSAYAEYDGTGQSVIHTPSTSNPFDAAAGGEVEHTLSVGIKGNWSVTDYLSLTGSLDVVYIWNMYNQEDVNESDMQLAIGCKLHY